MFFDDPQVAFSNLVGALMPVGRVVLVVWRDISLNPWAELPAKVGTELFGPAEPAPPGAPGPFGWADHSAFEPVLRRAGLREITWSGVDTTLKLGRKAEPDAVERAVDMLLCVGRSLGGCGISPRKHAPTPRGGWRRACRLICRTDGSECRVQSG